MLFRSTLARDVRGFSALGYQVVRVAAVDLFPRTRHVETVVLLSKLRTEHHIEVDLDLGGYGFDLCREQGQLR